jgi:hypothetical protein
MKRPENLLEDLVQIRVEAPAGPTAEPLAHRILFLNVANPEVATLAGGVAYLAW